MRFVVSVTMLASVLLHGGCRDAPDAASARDAGPRLRAVLVSDQTPISHRPHDLSTRADRMIRSAMLSSGRFSSSGLDDHTACAAEVDLMYAWIVNGAVVSDAPVGVARMLIEGSIHCLVPGDDENASESFRSEVAHEEPYGGAGQPSGAAVLDALLAQLSESLAGQLYGQVVMRHASDDRILAALRSDGEVGVLMEAASEAGERELTGGLPALIELTRHEDSWVVLRAAAAGGRLAHEDAGSAKALAAAPTL